MKKFFPLFSLFIVFLGILFGQYFFKNNDILARPTQVSKKVNAHYESRFKSSVFTNLHSKKLNLQKLSSKIIILNFWASWCKPCLNEFDSLVALKKKYKDEDIRIIAINSDEDNQRKMVNKIIKKYNLNFDIVLDKNGKVLQDYMIQALPVSIIFHKGKVVEVSNGAKDFVSIESLNKFKKYL